MGGKTWSREEELYFWRTIVPTSPKAAVTLRKAVDWEQSAVIMQRHFGRKARRNYTKLMLFEHYFQNISTGHESPRAADLVAEHKRHLEENGKEVNGIVAAHKIRTRRASKRYCSSKPAVKSSNSPPGQAHVRADGRVVRGAQPAATIIVDSPHEGREARLPLTHRLPYAANGYCGGDLYRGSPAVSQALGARWFSTEDSGYLSAASPASHGGSSTSLVDMEGDGGEGAAANATAG